MPRLPALAPALLCLTIAALSACGSGSSGAPASGGGTSSSSSSASSSSSETSSAATWWKPEASATWQWQISGTVDTSYTVTAYDIDLFDSDVTLIQQLQAKGRKVICYFSAGSSEDWRPDYSRFTASDQASRSMTGRVKSGWISARGIYALVMLN